MRAATQFIVSVLAATASTLAQSSNSTPVSGSVLTLMLDQSANLRPVLGVPGATWLAPAIFVDPALQILAISPRSDYILASRSDTGDLVVLSNPLGSMAPAVIPGAGGATGAVLSPMGTSALIQSPGGQWLVLTGLPNTPSIGRQVDLSGLPQQPSSVALSDDGTAVLAGIASSSGSQVFLLTAQATPRNLLTIGHLGGLAFVVNKTDALVADSASNQVQLIHDVAGAATASVIADAGAGVSSPVGVATSEDGQRIFVADSQPGGVLIANLQAGTQLNIACNCTPSGLTRLTPGSVFGLTSPTSPVFWVLDGNAANPRIVIVPPDPPATTGAAQ